MAEKFSIESRFDIAFTARLAQREKQIQQNYRPIIGIHKWFARRPGTVFRNLLLSEFSGSEPISSSYWRAHRLKGVIADPFMGGGTTIYEANRLGFSVVGTDINPMAYWIVSQSLGRLSIDDFKSAAAEVIHDVEIDLSGLYETSCKHCGGIASVKYFLWVKVQDCPSCGAENDLFPGYLLAEAVRHPRHVIACRHCGELNEFDTPPTNEIPAACHSCGALVSVQGSTAKNRTVCHNCNETYPYPPKAPSKPPRHRLWAIEYHCDACKPTHKGRFFKRPDKADLRRVKDAALRLKKVIHDLPIPEDEIPVGDETRRLHRWGYRRFQEMFSDRQLLGLGVLLKRINQVRNREVRHALLTVFSDALRYQNLLCRYDTYALKCQDIFSVHGFPVGLIQCENNLLGIHKVGSGGFRHFVEKYCRAKEYCLRPFETMATDRGKKIVPIEGETIAADFVTEFPEGESRLAYINASPATSIELRRESLDGVFTDPPYFDNVQYAELMDFCYAWLRLSLGKEFASFTPITTKAHQELTGNETMGRGLDHFAAGLSAVFCHYAAALKPSAPFVFTYHHNDPLAYAPLVVAILDSGLDCTATLPAPAEMSASLHIVGAKSSVVDSIFVCRSGGRRDSTTVPERLTSDVRALVAGGLKVTEGDIRCILAGHIARVAINQLRSIWNSKLSSSERLAAATDRVLLIRNELDAELLIIMTVADYVKQNER